MIQVLQNWQFYPAELSKYVQPHQNMQLQHPHFPRIWHPKHNQDALCFEHKLHLQHNTMSQVK